MPIRELMLSQAAELTRLSMPALRRRCAAGEIPGARLIGNRWVIPGRSVAAIIRRREPKGGWLVRRLEGGARIVARPDLEAEYDVPVYELILPGEVYAGSYEAAEAAEIHWRRRYSPEAIER